ncbi:OmpA family protein [Epibacterium sp. Ofav1-8]|uniref:OmpA family protein n=1 Tax=Epibacterium sp. Ofav1-8 TaxID=2917735 RepID=UPI001EF71866|nr:OmpA family protein [Epibacterium sp. Ofav1-8]MCG7625393.1 OmpA family protein [Epibacterium sp. Ofav1-8]
MKKRLYLLFLFTFLFSPILATANPFAGGWRLQTDQSNIGFLSVKKGTIAEYSGFASFSGAIDPTGTAKISVALDSVDTKIDLRNVRMRFLFFETFKHSEAVIETSLAPEQVANLAEMRRKTIDLSVDLTLHGVEANVTAPVAVTLLDDNTVNVATVQPIILSLADFDLLGGLAKLEEAANVTITPVGIVSLDLTFTRTGTDTEVAAIDAPSAGKSAALETSGTFNREECVGRFEILSQSRSLNFPPNTAAITDDASAFLDVLADVVNRCPDMKVEVGGHTDSWGKAAWNLELSRQRAVAVAKYLISKGAAQSRLVPVGYGETSPLVDNNTLENRAKNRRIEFKVLN